MQQYRISAERHHIVAVLVVAFITISALGYWNVAKYQAVSAEAPASTTQPEWGTLQASSLTKLELDSLSQLRHYSAGIDVLNISDTTILFSPGLQAFIVDSDGQQYPATAKFLAEDTIIGGSIKPGARWRGALDFEVPDSAVPAAIVVEKDASSPTLKDKF